MSKYTTKIGKLIYEPNGKDVKLKDCYDITKYKQLVAKINVLDISEEEKFFLKLAATRHIGFRYDKIADYYSNNAGADMQCAMEESALVIIDIDKAIENGYCKLSGDIETLMEGRFNG